MFDLGLFASGGDGRYSSLKELLGRVTVLDLHGLALEESQRVAASFFLQRLYRAMFVSGPADRLQTAVVFDEAHRVAKLRLLPRMMQECRKYGIAFLVSSQRVDDFDQAVLDSAGNHLYLRVNHPDARRLSAYLGAGKGQMDPVRILQELPRHFGVFRSEDYQPFTRVQLRPPGRVSR